jgi:hypothetical protein
VRQRAKVGEILIKAGVIDEMQLRAALGDQSNWGGRLGVTLVKMGLVEERDLVRALAQQLQIPVVQLDGKRVQQEVLDLVPAEIAEKHLCVPLFVKEQGGTKSLYIGMDDPGNLEAIDDLSFRTGLSIHPVLVSPSELCEAIDRFYHRSSRELTSAAEGDESNGLSMDGAVARGAAAERAPVHESLFREVGELQDSTDDPEIPTDFGPATAVGEPASPGSAPAENDPSRTILRALCQLLIEKGVIAGDELQGRVRALEEE